MQHEMQHKKINPRFYKDFIVAEEGFEPPTPRV